MWFWFSVIALLCWSGSDLFSKIGCREANDKTAHLKMVMAVGIVMGLHACFEIFVNGVEINMQIIMTYLPVSLLYILSMAMGYIGLRYIELSISSPICNSSGALVAIATIAMSGIGDMNAWQLAAIAGARRRGCWASPRPRKTTAACGPSAGEQSQVCQVPAGAASPDCLLHSGCGGHVCGQPCA
ncbi:MAG: hypothetical protein ACLTV6_10970 [Christensenellales bacterium]